MDTSLVPGTRVPPFDRDITAWLHRARHHHPRDNSGAVIIGVRNQDHHIYRYITAKGRGQYFDAINFFSQTGFSALPVEFAKETGLDYIYHRDEW